MEAGEVLDEDIVRAALQRDVVVAGVDFTIPNDDSLAAGVYGIGVGGIAGSDNAEVFDGDVLAAGDEVKHG